MARLGAALVKLGTWTRARLALRRSRRNAATGGKSCVGNRVFRVELFDPGVVMPVFRDGRLRYCSCTRVYCSLHGVVGEPA